MDKVIADEPVKVIAFDKLFIGNKQLKNNVSYFKYKMQGLNLKPFNQIGYE